MLGAALKSPCIQNPTAGSVGLDLDFPTSFVGVGGSVPSGFTGGSNGIGKMEETYVYIIQKGWGSIKIGVAKDPDSRLRQLQTANHRDLRVVARLPCESRERAFDLERTLHNRLSKFRLANSEWFRKAALRELRRINVVRDEHLDGDPEHLFDINWTWYLDARKEFDGKPRKDLLMTIARQRRKLSKLRDLNEQRLAMLANRV